MMVGAILLTLIGITSFAVGSWTLYRFLMRKTRSQAIWVPIFAMIAQFGGGGLVVGGLTIINHL